METKTITTFDEEGNELILECVHQIEFTVVELPQAKLDAVYSAIEELQNRRDLTPREYGHLRQLVMSLHSMHREKSWMETAITNHSLEGAATALCRYYSALRSVAKEYTELTRYIIW